MRQATTSVLFLLAIVLAAGCAGVSTVEREYLTKPETREEYLHEHPDCAFVRQIRNGEIMRGMIAEEVMASWGLPNVYMASDTSPQEFWVYYVQGSTTNSILIYTLVFDDAQLGGWEIDQKRFTDTRIVSDVDFKGMEPVSTLSTKKQRR